MHRMLKDYEAEVLEWLGLDSDFREQEETQYSYVDYLMGLAYPSMPVSEIQGLKSTPTKLRLLLKSLYLAEYPLSFEDVFRIFTPRELGFLLLDLQDAFCDDNHRFLQYLGDPVTHGMVFEQIKSVVLDSGCLSLDELLGEIGLDVLLAETKSLGYRDFDPMMLINRRDHRGFWVWRGGMYVAKQGVR